MLSSKLHEMINDVNCLMEITILLRSIFFLDIKSWQFLQPMMQIY